MKVVHIATMDHGGAGIAACRIHNALLRQGVESRMLVKSKHSDDDTIVEVQPNQGLYIPSSVDIIRKIEKIQRRRGRCLTQVEQYERQLTSLDRQFGAAFTMPVSNYDLSRHSLVQEADLVHLHWVENFLDYPTFFRVVDKPIVWTFHDENLCYGGFHYSDDAIQMSDPYASIENEFLQIKKQAFADCLNIHVVALSRMMEQLYRQKAVSNRYPVEVIHNGVEIENYPMLDQGFCRKVLGLSEEEKALCFCATDINDPHKGLKLLIRALEKTGIPGLKLLCVGKGNLPKSKIKTIPLGTIQNPRFMAVVYSASDLFVMPSFQESFAQAPVEAMICGCPVVAFSCGVMEELINDSNGILCQEFTEESLFTGVMSALSTKYKREAIRQDAVERFNIDKIVNQYINLYNRCK